VSAKSFKMSKAVTIILSAFFLFSMTGFTQQQPARGIASGNYKVVNRSISLVGDGTDIHLSEADGAGIAWIRDKTFTEGVIEFDVKGKDAMQKSFVGIAFHGVNDSTYESVYFRPFNFKAADPERNAHAVQYIAVPLYDWPRLRAERHNQYEKPVSPAPDPNDWFHVRIRVTGKMISVFVNDQSTPALEVAPLADLNGKMIGYWVGNGSGGDWKNLTITGN
jgi:hypothetical protein